MTAYGIVYYPSGSNFCTCSACRTKKQIKAEERNLDAHRAAYDSVQEYLDVMKELRSDGLEKAYLEDVDKS